MKQINNYKKKNDNNKKYNSQDIALWICIGLAIGTAVGLITNNLSLWMPVGISLGVCYGVSLNKGGEDSEEKDETDNNNKD